MKYRWFFAIFLALAGLTILSAQEKSLESTMLIRVEKAAVRAEPSFVSPALSFAAYKTPVAIIRIENDWIFGFVRGLNRPGYIHMSALSPVKVSLNPDDVSDPPPLQETEIVLAGKGFSSSLELSLRESSAFNFEAVDAMEKNSYSYAECLAFIHGIDILEGEP
ncbi:MAG TPA: hypothetical protein PLE76_03520 [Rectinema sp.]|jgi:hypothetical protein|nr:hypothetical protein [Rectinema sp.]HNV35565.1 hypothetical protein [Rectinema sp.]HNZ92839.1 hypothetical protein [Rectinema sp.]HOC26993.1 hypothetical protein [Rectinema sp.]HOH16354.1 hypothetical protein [Rectinema sp.]